MSGAQWIAGVRLAGWMVAAAATVVLVVACGARGQLSTEYEAAGGTSAVGGQGGTAGTTTQPVGGSGGAPPWPTLFVITFISDVDESIWVNETDAAWLNGHWLTLERGGEILRKAKACEICACDECPNCPICGAPCPTATEIPSPGSVEYAWSGYEYRDADCPSAPQETCLEEVAAPAGSYVAEFCWGTSFEGSPPCPADVVDVQCAEVTFQHPDPDGVVEFVVNNGG